jgi:hypothetical protein
MNMNILVKGTFAAALVGTVLASSYGCDQPKAKCAAGRGSFAVLYKPAPGSAPECADFKGEEVGFGTYNQVGKDNKPNLDVAQIAIQPVGLGNLADLGKSAGAPDPAADHKPYSLGFFTTAEAEGDFCFVPTLTQGIQNIPEIKEDEENEIEASPATSVQYEWSNVRLYVTPSALGTQFTADVKITTDGKACQYSAIGMYPYVPCGTTDPKDEKKEIPDDLDGIARSCAPEADEDAGRPTGSGINPDFPTHCDPDILACTLTKDTIPALK